VSAFRKRAEDNPVPAFDSLVPRFLAMDRGWPELITLMRDLLRPERLTVVDYAQRGSSRDLLAGLIPHTEAAAFDEPQATVNLSATDAALAALQARYHAGQTLDRAEWKAVIADHAADTDARGFAAFGAEDRARLDARYATDLDRVANLQGVVCRG